jgi:hypothetical protein
MAHHHPDIGLRTPEGAGKGLTRHVAATVSRVFPDRYDHDGAEHQHIWIDDLQPLDDGSSYAGDVFVAIRVTEVIGQAPTDHRRLKASITTAR